MIKSNFVANSPDECMTKEQAELMQYSTSQLVNDLKRRTGVRVIETDPETLHRIQVIGFDKSQNTNIMGTGPAILLEVID